MTVANGYQLPDLILFVTSLLETGYNGDLVISLSDINPKTLAYFHHQMDRIILYDIGFRCRRLCQVDLYRDKNGSLLVFHARSDKLHSFGLKYFGPGLSCILQRPESFLQTFEMCIFSATLLRIYPR